MDFPNIEEGYDKDEKKNESLAMVVSGAYCAALPRRLGASGGRTDIVRAAAVRGGHTRRVRLPQHRIDQQYGQCPDRRDVGERIA